MISKECGAEEIKDEFTLQREEEKQKQQRMEEEIQRQIALQKAKRYAEDNPEAGEEAAPEMEEINIQRSFIPLDRPERKSGKPAMIIAVIICMAIIALVAGLVGILCRPFFF